MWDRSMCLLGEVYISQLFALKLNIISQDFCDNLLDSSLKKPGYVS